VLYWFLGYTEISRGGQAVLYWFLGHTGGQATKSAAMARKLRIEYPGAIYPVLNRGNFRRDLLETTGAAEAFLSVHLESAGRFGWNFHA
jgi:hypothetical protein